MTTETITRVKLIASEGMVLTDGENYGKEVFLAVDADQTKWHEITQAEYDAILASEAADQEAGA